MDTATSLCELSAALLQVPCHRGPQVPRRLKLSSGARDACNTTLHLWELGFWDEEAIATNLKAWASLLAKVKPDAVLADLAPFALLAAAGRLPTFCIGNGYFVPAMIEGYFTPDGQPPSMEDKAAQDVFFANILSAFKKAGLHPLPDAARALCGDYSCPATLPALDPKFDLRPDLLAPPGLDEVPEEPGELRGEEILIYTGRDSTGHTDLVKAVARTDLKASLYLPDSAVAPLPLGRNMSIQNSPFSLKQISEKARLLVHHGGIGITHLGVLAGVPQIVGYRGHERWTNAKAIHRQGAGEGKAMGAVEVNDLAELISHHAKDGPHRKAAQAWAEASHVWIAGRRGQDVIADRFMNFVSN